MRASTRVLAASVALLGAIAGIGGAQDTRPLSVEAALAQPSFQRFAPIALSPDGKLVSYTLTYPNRATQSAVGAWYTRTGVPNTAAGARVRITDVQTGRTTIVGDDAATSWGPAWSPDGRKLAFYSDAGGVAHLWLRDVATGRTRRVSDAIVRAHQSIERPRWTPDGRAVVLPIVSYGSALPEGVAALTGEQDVIRRRDSATVRVLRADPAMPSGGQAKSGTRESDVHEALRADLALIDIATGHVTTLATGYWPLEFAVSPDGRFVSFSSEHPPTYQRGWRIPYDLMIVPLAGGKPGRPRAVAKGAAITNYARGVFWSPTSATLLYSATDTSGVEQYFAADSSDWRPRRVATSGVIDTIGSSMRSIWWDESGRAFYILAKHSIVAVSMPDGLVRSMARVPSPYQVLSIAQSGNYDTAPSGGGRSLLVSFRNDSTKLVGFARIDLAWGGWQVLREEDRHYGTRREVALDVAQDGTLIYRSEDGQHPADLWLGTPDLVSTRRITHVAPWMEGVTFGRTQLIDYATPNGPRRATLLLPARYRAGTRYPLIVYPYPIDRRSNDVNTFGVTGTATENMQLLATRGFAVLAPDVDPFSSTELMRELAAIILAGVDRVIEMGVADSARIGIMGHSWGGYTTLALISQTDRFGAAVMRGGLGDWVTMTATLQTTGYAYGIDVDQLILGTTLWEKPEVYHRNSPIYLLDRVHTPLLIIHGEGETTVPIFLADQVFAGLQHFGREVEFARYANEKHTESLWSYPNQRDFLTRMIGWFETHLKARERPTASKP